MPENEIRSCSKSMVLTRADFPEGERRSAVGLCSKVAREEIDDTLQNGDEVREVRVKVEYILEDSDA
jgi:hypothetical protein